MSNSLWTPGLQHAKLPCLSLSLRVYSNSWPLSWWCYLTISFSTAFFCLQSFTASGSFPMSWLFTSGGQSIGAGASASPSVLPVNVQDWFPLGWTGLISLQCKGPSLPSSPAAAATKSLQSCPTLCDPIDGSPPGSAVPEILQARTLEWVAISFSNAWKWKVKVKSLSRVQLSATPWTAAYQTPLSMGFSRQEYWSGVPSPSLMTNLDNILKSRDIILST